MIRVVMSEISNADLYGEAAHALFEKHRIDVVAFVPDGGQKRLIELYGETGRQQTHTALGVDLAAVARACGFEGRTVTQQSALPDLRNAIHAAKGSLFAVLKVASDEVPRAFPPRNGAYLTHRTREALLGRESALEA
jgi:thiamine pyrophosphate-dependent acetolactate synthase large subunit-like protein